jgi:menaquinol-cytochrome c reductase iron-sulfur subunit
MSLSRRGFLAALIAGIAGVVSLLSGGTLLAFFAGVLRRDRQLPQWVRVCRLDELDSMEPKHFRIVFERERLGRAYEDVRGVFAILTEAGPLVFTNVCSHMKCSVRWLSWRQQITCPCHGGFYDRWGKLIGGPPPFSLPAYESEVRGGEVFIRDAYKARSET